MAPPRLQPSHQFQFVTAAGAHGERGYRPTMEDGYK